MNDYDIDPLLNVLAEIFGLDISEDADAADETDVEEAHLVPVTVSQLETVFDALEFYGDAVGRLGGDLEVVQGIRDLVDAVDGELLRIQGY